MQSPQYCATPPPGYGIVDGYGLSITMTLPMKSTICVCVFSNSIVWHVELQPKTIRWMFTSEKLRRQPDRQYNTHSIIGSHLFYSSTRYYLICKREIAIFLLTFVMFFSRSAHLIDLFQHRRNICSNFFQLCEQCAKLDHCLIRWKGRGALSCTSKRQTNMNNVLLNSRRNILPKEAFVFKIWLTVCLCIFGLLARGG